MISSPIMIAPIPISHPYCRTLDRRAAQLAEALEAVVNKSEPAVHRHQEPENGDMTHERERDAQKKQPAPRAGDDPADHSGGPRAGRGRRGANAAVEKTDTSRAEDPPKQA